MAAIIALSGCIRIQPYGQSFAPQNISIDFPVTLTNVTITANTSVPAAAISETDCATDFADVLPADNRFDDRPLADWGDRDEACDPYPQNDREF